MTPPHLPSVTTRPFRTRFRFFDFEVVIHDKFKALSMTSSIVGGPWANLNAGIWTKKNIRQPVPGMTLPRLPSVNARPFCTRFRFFDFVGVGHATFEALGMTTLIVRGPWATLHAGIYGQNSILRPVPGRTRSRSFEFFGVGHGMFKAPEVNKSIVRGPWAILHAGI